MHATHRSTCHARVAAVGCTVHAEGKAWKAGKVEGARRAATHPLLLGLDAIEDTLMEGAGGERRRATQSQDGNGAKRVRGGRSKHGCTWWDLAAVLCRPKHSCQVPHWSSQDHSSCMPVDAPLRVSPAFTVSRKKGTFFISVLVAGD